MQKKLIHDIARFMELVSHYSVRAPYVPPPHTAEATKIHGIQKTAQQSIFAPFQENCL
jgi:hypothetical protein